MSKIKTIIYSTLAMAFCANSAFAQVPITANYDPTIGLLDANAPELNLIALDKKYFEIAKHNYEEGYWKVFQGKSGAPRGEFCTAMFARKDMSVTLHGPGGNYNMALLSFMHLNKDSVSAANNLQQDGAEPIALSTFPTPNGASKLKINFQQGKEAPIDITAINTTMDLPSGKVGVISLPVPTIEALMGGMEDNYRFVIRLDGKIIGDIEWNKGLLARDELKKCLAGSQTEFTNMLK